MMNRLRIARSLHPAGGRPGPRIKPGQHVETLLPYRLSAGSAGPDARAVRPGRALYMRPYFLKVAAQSCGEPVERFLRRALAADDERIDRGC